MEAVITIDVLRRAGAEVTVASVEDVLQVSCSRQVQLVADKLLQDCQGSEFDLIALPVRWGLGTTCRPPCTCPPCTYRRGETRRARACAGRHARGGAPARQQAAD